MDRIIIISKTIMIAMFFWIVALCKPNINLIENTLNMQCSNLYENTIYVSSKGDQE